MSDSNSISETLVSVGLCMGRFSRYVVNVNNGRFLFNMQLVDLVLRKSLRLNP